MPIQQISNRLLVTPGSGGGTILTRLVITSGVSVTIPGGNYRVTFDPASVIANYVLALPVSPSDQDLVEIEAGGTIANGAVINNLTISGTKIEAIRVTTLMAGEFIKYKYRATNASWYRKN